MSQKALRCRVDQRPGTAAIVSAAHNLPYSGAYRLSAIAYRHLVGAAALPGLVARAASSAS